MSFNPYQEIAKIPHIGTVRITLQKTLNPSEPEAQSVKFMVSVDDQFHNPMDNRSGNLIPHLTAQEIQQLQTFMDLMWQKAETEILQ